MPAQQRGMSVYWRLFATTVVWAFAFAFILGEGIVLWLVWNEDPVCGIRLSGLYWLLLGGPFIGVVVGIPCGCLVGVLRCLPYLARDSDPKQTEGEEGRGRGS
jgi:hypothetical protein